MKNSKEASDEVNEDVDEAVKNIYAPTTNRCEDPAVATPEPSLLKALEHNHRRG
jgi:hypothetical protein